MLLIVIAAWLALDAAIVLLWVLFVPRRHSARDADRSSARISAGRL